MAHWYLHGLLRNDGLLYSSTPNVFVSLRDPQTDTCRLIWLAVANRSFVQRHKLRHMLRIMSNSVFVPCILSDREVLACRLPVGLKDSLGMAVNRSSLTRKGLLAAARQDD